MRLFSNSAVNGVRGENNRIRLHKKPGRFGLLLGWLTIFLCLLALSSCVNKLDKFIQEPPAIDTKHIKQKEYNKPPLSQDKLADLLDMAAYNGPPERYGLLTLRRTSGNTRMAPVMFSHMAHRSKYTCRVCHLELEFSFKNGESGITREDNLDGRFCGACHDGSTSFSVESACSLCHLNASQRKTYQDQSYATLAERLPASKHGDRLDWSKALREGVIAPKYSLYENTPPTSMALPTHLKKPLMWYTNVEGVYVEFPHQEHIAWLDCANCHPDLFSMKNMGTESFDKEKNLYGMFCGACHMTVAFPMDGCSRCHPGINDLH